MSVAVLSRSVSSTLPGSITVPVKPVVRSKSAVYPSQKAAEKRTPDEKMYGNFLEAIAQHNSFAKALPLLTQKKPESPLYLTCTTKSEKGPVRKTMEDAHFDFELPDGHLVGIFDGHGEMGRIASQVSELFQQQFLPELEKTPNDVRRVFIDLCSKAQSEITDTAGGTTALIVYFHNAANRFYTATLGDSEMRIYRKIGDTITAIPVSLVRDWCSIKDEKRFLAAVGSKTMLVEAMGLKTRKIVNCQAVCDAWLAQKNPKGRRFPPELPRFSLGGVNTSRSLGDLRMVWRDENTGETTCAISRKPKVSMCQAVADEKAEDKVIFACDGLWDYANEEAVIKILQEHWNNPLLADLLVEYAIKTAKSQDNVTVTVGTLSKVPPPEEVTPPISRTATLPLLTGVL